MPLMQIRYGGTLLEKTWGWIEYQPSTSDEKPGIQAIATTSNDLLPDEKHS